MTETGTSTRRAPSGRWALPELVGPDLFRRLALTSVVALVCVIVTGGAVRLTDSGLGCPDWPTCTQHHLVAALSLHPMVEFVNRVITILLSLSLTATVLGALLRRPRRNDLLLASGALVVGVILQIVLGGLVVLYKLWPPLVMAHFLLTIVMLGIAVVLHARSASASGRGVPMVGTALVWLSRVMVATLLVVITAGTAVTGAGPHAGNAASARLPVPFNDAAFLHADLVMFLIGLTLASLFGMIQAGVPDSVMRRGRTLLVVMILQAAVGYSQYVLHDAPLLVGFHLLGAASLWVTMLRFHLGLFARPGSALPARVAAPPRLAMAGGGDSRLGVTAPRDPAAQEEPVAGRIAL